MHKYQIMNGTIGGMNNFRDLSKHNGDHAKTGESKIYLASIFSMSKRWTTKHDSTTWGLENDEKSNQNSEVLTILPNLRRSL